MPVYMHSIFPQLTHRRSSRVRQSSPTPSTAPPPPLRPHPPRPDNQPPKARSISFAHRPPLPYDALSIDIGITPGAGGAPGAREHTTPVKPINRCVAAATDPITNTVCPRLS